MKRTWKKWIALSLAIGILGICTPFVLYAEETDNNTMTATVYANQNGTWTKTNGRYWYRYSDGSCAKNGIYTIDGAQYAFDASGWMVTGWYKDSTSTWYYFDSSGKMVHGWLQLGSKRYYMDLNDGHMYVDTWDWIDKHLYVFTTDGSVHTGWYKDVYDDNTYDWLYFDADGKMHCGWLQLGNKWYYMHPDEGWMYADTTLEIDGNDYKFNADGTMFTGWYQEEDDWYYYGNKGMHKGWLQLGSKRYYMDPTTGAMNYGATYFIDDAYYHFNEDGTMHTGWYKFVWDDGDIDTYYFDSNGKEHFGWLQLESSWYYFDLEDGIMVVDTDLEIDGNNYKFNADGTMYKGWYQEEDNWYYYGNKGMHRGWLHLGNAWYYMSDLYGFMYNDTWERIDGDMYRFDQNGTMHVGWLKYYWEDSDETKYYYYDEDGKEHVGWLQFGKAWYYMDLTYGEMVTDKNIDIDGKTYRFKTDGTMFTGWYQNQDDWYYFSKSGAMQKGWLQLGNTWYYMDPKNGSMYHSRTAIIDGKSYTFNADGTLKQFS